MKKLIYLLLFYPILSSSCTRENDNCYDQNLVHNNACTTDCPGVCGCDGNTYCNECEANRNGISVVSDSPCR